ncbi:MAG TPA: hypothetical protein VN914_07620, partial [Polyangia bacterium]|nr:hypothetical protein [Polyangia bacterium]
MPRPPLVSALLVCACTFHPDIDPLAVRCVLGDLDGCPEGYVCGAAAGEPAGRGRCCRDGDCPLVPDGGPPDTSVVDGAPPPDAPLEGPASCDSPCAPGSKSCGPKLGLRTCVQAGGCWTWSAEETCPGHMSCNGQSPG